MLVEDDKFVKVIKGFKWNLVYFIQRVQIKFVDLKCEPKEKYKKKYLKETKSFYLNKIILLDKKNNPHTCQSRNKLNLHKAKFT